MIRVDWRLGQAGKRSSGYPNLKRKATRRQGREPSIQWACLFCSAAFLVEQLLGCRDALPDALDKPPNLAEHSTHSEAIQVSHAD